MPGRFRRSAVAFVAVLAMAMFGGVPASHAQEPEPAAGLVVLGSRALGFGEDVPFRGNHDEVTVTVPVPTGLTPRSLDAVVEMPADVQRGWIDVESDGRTLARIDLPGAPATDAPVSIPLDGATVDRNAVAVTLRITLVPLEAICPQDWFGRSVTLRDTRVVYDGTPTDPTVIADFLPPVLERLDVYVPESPTDAESAAALALSTAIVAYYGAQPVQVRVRPLPGTTTTPTEADGPFERSVVVRETGDAATELVPAPAGPGALVLTGDDRTLMDQARLVTSHVSSVAVDARAIAGAMDRPPQLAPDSTTLGGLGLGTLTARGVGQVQVELTIDQSRLGRASGNLRIHLQGNYSPPPDNQSGLLTVSIGDQVLDSWPADDTGTIDRWIDVPDEDLGRYTTLDVTLQNTGGTNQCGLEQPSTLTIFPQSEVSSSATPGNPSGFQALPQALLPAVQVAGTVGGFDDTARAVAILTGLQSLTTVSLDPEWVPVDEAVSSGAPAVLVVADGALPEGVNPPLTETDGVTLELASPTADGSTTLTLGSQTNFAALQAWVDNGREVLLAGSTADPAELDRTLRWLAADPDRWAGLSGDVLFTAEGRDPVDLSLPPDSSQQPSESLPGVAVAVLYTAGALAVIGVILAVVAATRPRRSPHDAD
ncbi:hypothetical protein G4H71_13440 [Rhodococcus triatomae]|uniref:Cellulose synthase subunit n=1 Tax=Rhodococcus triatomae TaxID=300028 RepID=A0A1G8H6P9_9NOCA|nr:cellulose biosynthesis cyclic di-GMP-binding regulatory protein BcsB [Rhodococcus triatomae]QNG20192.1 hypothetical protein G4H72_16940 [Rhodococcus triatomae]QNG23893.1 hypothetical protein G4H71_13440 [Rhodococcus triatomae]SDI02229.1 cellulose synthase subunit [Rhodococcus triatomae]